MRIIHTFLPALFVLFISFTAFAADNASEADVKKTITDYISAVDSRNLSAVQQSLYSDATLVTVNTISKKTNYQSSSDIISRIKSGSLGGWKREVNVGSVDFTENTAMAKVEVTDSKVKQTSYVTLVNDNGNWKIVSEVSTIAANK